MPNSSCSSTHKRALLPLLAVLALAMALMPVSSAAHPLSSLNKRQTTPQPPLIQPLLSSPSSALANLVAGSPSSGAGATSDSPSNAAALPSTHGKALDAATPPASGSGNNNNNNAGPVNGAAINIPVLPVSPPAGGSGGGSNPPPSSPPSSGNGGSGGVTPGNGGGQSSGGTGNGNAGSGTGNGNAGGDHSSVAPPAPPPATSSPTAAPSPTAPPSTTAAPTSASPTPSPTTDANQQQKDLTPPSSTAPPSGRTSHRASINGSVSQDSANTSSSGASSTTIALISAAAVVAFVGVVAGVWVFRKWKLKPSRTFKQKLNPDAPFQNRGRTYDSDARFVRDLRDD
ncbi:hypothetical protein RI367_005582 [Sorochytrium milnesiophthora]